MHSENGEVDARESSTERMTSHNKETTNENAITTKWIEIAGKKVEVKYEVVTSAEIQNRRKHDLKSLQRNSNTRTKSDVYAKRKSKPVESKQSRSPRKSVVTTNNKEVPSETITNRKGNGTKIDAKYSSYENMKVEKVEAKLAQSLVEDGVKCDNRFSLLTFSEDDGIDLCFSKKRRKGKKKYTVDPKCEDDNVNKYNLSSSVAGNPATSQVQNGFITKLYTVEDEDEISKTVKPVVEIPVVQPQPEPHQLRPRNPSVIKRHRQHVAPSKPERLPSTVVEEDKKARFPLRFFKKLLLALVLAFMLAVINIKLVLYFFCSCYSEFS